MLYALVGDHNVDIERDGEIKIKVVNIVPVIYELKNLREYVLFK